MTMRMTNDKRRNAAQAAVNDRRAQKLFSNATDYALVMCLYNREARRAGFGRIVYSNITTFLQQQACSVIQYTQRYRRSIACGERSIL